MGGRTHGLSGNSRRSSLRPGVYNSWASMMQRCTNPRNPRYADYGGRGIKVCERWVSFANFRADMGDRPPGTKLERRENDKGYGPDNCEWATHKAQCRNTRRTVMVTIDGVERPRIEWCELYGISEVVVRARINRNGWDPVAAITTPAMQPGHRR